MAEALNGKAVLKITAKYLAEIDPAQAQELRTLLRRRPGVLQHMRRCRSREKRETFDQRGGDDHGCLNAAGNFWLASHAFKSSTGQLTGFPRPESARSTTSLVRPNAPEKLTAELSAAIAGVAMQHQSQCNPRRPK